MSNQLEGKLDRFLNLETKQLDEYNRAEYGRTCSKRQNNFLRPGTSNWMIVFSFTLRSLVVMECSPTSFETNTIAESSSLKIKERSALDSL